MVGVFISYSHVDETARNLLEKHLSVLKRNGEIDVWHDRRILAGQEFANEIDERINSDRVILLLVSPDFLASSYCTEIEMRQALERHEKGDAIVVPVIVRPCDWRETKLAKLRATPTDGRPISKWPDRDEAYQVVVSDVRDAVRRLGQSDGFKTHDSKPSVATSSIPLVPLTGPQPRSSNLAIGKIFSDHEKHEFSDQSYRYIKLFFENSLRELSERNGDIRATFEEVTSRCFVAAIYRSGTLRGGCTIRSADGPFRGGIQYSNGMHASAGTFNEILSVEADEQSLYLRGLGMHVAGGSVRGSQKLSQEGAAEHLWSMFLAPLKR